MGIQYRGKGLEAGSRFREYASFLVFFSMLLVIGGGLFIGLIILMSIYPDALWAQIVVVPGVIVSILWFLGFFITGIPEYTLHTISGAWPCSWDSSDWLFELRPPWEKERDKPFSC